MSNKKQGWEIKLSNYIEENKDKAFKRGVRDCALFAGRCIDLMTGSNTVKEFLKPYKSKKQAFDLLKSLGYDNLSAVADKYLGEALPSPAYASRGDCVLIRYEHEENDEPEALAIVDLSGRKAVTFGKKGLTFYPMKLWVKAWKV